MGWRVLDVASLSLVLAICVLVSAFDGAIYCGLRIFLKELANDWLDVAISLLALMTIG